jgi:1,4-alpha-glucan branching enzyme
MITKKYSKDRKKCRVTFKLPVEINSDTVQLYGEFNNWVGQEMTRQKKGGFSLSITLEAGRTYQFRYLLDDSRWTNDNEADRFVPNPYGTEDSVLEI